ncbi:MAG: hypothetical protein JO032_19255, partial [Alphaproteobacteria bacterium]|nr:hypothetical protein [Alphaproteobacteria bacterium]
GRVRAYEDGLVADADTLDAALARNLYGTAAASPEQMRRVGDYLRRAAAALALAPLPALLTGKLAFAAP